MGKTLSLIPSTMQISKSGVVQERQEDQNAKVILTRRLCLKTKTSKTDKQANYL